VGSDNAPAFREADPELALASVEGAGGSVAFELEAEDAADEAGGGAGFAEGLDRSGECVYDEVCTLSSGRWSARRSFRGDENSDGCIGGG
jgi:hypothetical protein